MRFKEGCQRFRENMNDIRYQVILGVYIGLKRRQYYDLWDRSIEAMEDGSIDNLPEELNTKAFELLLLGLEPSDIWGPVAKKHLSIDLSRKEDSND